MEHAINFFCSHAHNIIRFLLMRSSVSVSLTSQLAIRTTGYYAIGVKDQRCRKGRLHWLELAHNFGVQSNKVVFSNQHF